jgi:hypothetical protein
MGGPTWPYFTIILASAIPEVKATKAAKTKTAQSILLVMMTPLVDIDILKICQKEFLYKKPALSNKKSPSLLLGYRI